MGISYCEFTDVMSMLPIRIPLYCSCTEQAFRITCWWWPWMRRCYVTHNKPTGSLQAFRTVFLRPGKCFSHAKPQWVSWCPLVRLQAEGILKSGLLCCIHGLHSSWVWGRVWSFLRDGSQIHLVFNLKPQFWRGNAMWFASRVFLRTVINEPEALLG